MGTSFRADLYNQYVSALPKLETHRSVLKYVKSQAAFSKVHATEGHAYMTSWSNSEVAAADVTQQTPCPTQDIGFATPVLKPRAPRVQNPNTDPQTQKPGITNVEQHHPQPKQASQSKLGTQGKLTCASLPKEPRKRKGISKRAQAIQSDEENRLQERRDRKRAKREIMQLGKPLAKKGSGHKDGGGQSSSKSKSNKTKLPAGLALMHGFTATNVGKHRLTIDPPIRPGVFWKGKASAPTRVRKSTNKGPGVNQVFSEERFLKSAAAGLKSIGSTHSFPASQSSEASSERADDQNQSPLSVELLGPRSRGSASRPDTEVVIPATKSVAKLSPPKPRVSQQSPGETRSMVWDIERDGDLLPSDSSSLDPGCKPSTILLNVTCQKRIIHSPVQTKVVSQERPSDKQPANPGACTDPPDRVAGAGSPSAISSVRPSESPSQLIVAGRPNTIPGPGQIFMRSKYFGAPSPSCAESDKEPGTAQPSGATAIAPHNWNNKDAPELRPHTEAGLPLRNSEHDGSRLELTSSLGKGAVHLAWWHGNDTDWLFGDQDIPDNTSGQDGNETWLFTEVLGPVPAYPGDPTQDRILFPVEEIHMEWNNNCDYPGVWRSPRGNAFHDIQTRAGVPENNGDLLAEQAGPGSCNTDSIGQSPARTPFDNWSEQYHDPDPVSYEVTTGMSSYEQDPNDFANDEGDSLTAPPLLFNEGRKLLLGYTACADGPTHWKSTGSVMESIEADVARHLVGHWMPQKY